MRRQQLAGMLAIAMVALALGTASATAEPFVPGYLAQTTATLQETDDELTNLDVPLRIESRPSPHFFWGTRFRAARSGAMGWIGLQPAGGANKTRVAVFSVWGAWTWDGPCHRETGGFGEPITVCIKEIPWNEDTEYVLRIRAGNRDASGRYLSLTGSLVDAQSGEEQRIGRIGVEPVLLSGPIRHFTQYFGEVDSCADLHATAIFREVTANDGSVRSTIGSSSKHACAAQVKIACENQGCTHAVDGAGSDIDIDGDGLLNSWESHGLDDDGDGDVDLDLPAMGADPHHKDVFVELDSMERLRIDDRAIRAVVASFARAPVGNADGRDGIHLHIDNGADAVMNARTGETWGTRSDADIIPFRPTFGFCGNEACVSGGPVYNWADFVNVRTRNFDRARRRAFHYGVSVGRTSSGDLGPSVGGLANGSDFLLALGRDEPDPVLGTPCPRRGQCLSQLAWQIGTLMHELGHTLDLEGDDRRPNHLSIMNYDFSLTGLIRTPPLPKGPDTPEGLDFDYSRFGPEDGLLPLDENHIDERQGLGPGPAVLRTTYATVGHCPDLDPAPIWRFGTPSDFNCDGDPTQQDLHVDIDRDGQLSVLPPLNEWRKLDYEYGAVGHGDVVPEPEETRVEEPSDHQLYEYAKATRPPPTAGEARVVDLGADFAELRMRVDPGDLATTVLVTLTDGSDERSAIVRQAPHSGAREVAVRFDGLRPSTRHQFSVSLGTVIHNEADVRLGEFETLSAPGSGPPSPGPISPSVEDDRPPRADVLIPPRDSDARTTSRRGPKLKVKSASYTRGRAALRIRLACKARCPVGRVVGRVTKGKQRLGQAAGRFKRRFMTLSFRIERVPPRHLRLRLSGGRMARPVFLKVSLRLRRPSPGRQKGRG